MQNSNFNHLYWIGGSPCGGKSTIAKMLAKHCGLALYSIDDELPHLLQTITKEIAPALWEWEQQTWEERWMQSVDKLLEFVIQAYDESFHLCMEEIQSLPDSPPILVEGNPLRPEIIVPYLPDKHHAIWLIAKEDDLRHYYSQREWAHHVLKETSDPVLAFSNWMKRDIKFASNIRKACATHELPYLMSDRQLSLEMKAQKVADHFQLSCDL